MELFFCIVNKKEKEKTERLRVIPEQNFYPVQTHVQTPFLREKLSRFTRDIYSRLPNKVKRT